jgi:hypothetical protein
MSQFQPFADDTATWAIGEFNAENGTHVVSLYGTLDITRDQIGLGHARALQTLLSNIVASLEATADLPTRAPAQPQPSGQQTVKNPFV